MHELDLEDVLEASFSPPPSNAAWRQFDVALARVAGDARPSARRFFARVLPWWQAQRAAGHVSRWFFMRKPPDVRLRFLCTPPAADALTALAAECAAMVACGDLVSAVGGEYQPETARFGGAQALDCAHAWFTLDSVAWWLLDRHVAAGGAHPMAEDWLYAIYDDLFATVGADDGWRRLAVHVELPSPAAITRELPRGEALAACAAHDAPLIAALAAAYRAANRRFAAALAALDLPVGHAPADIAALTAFFSFNRHGFPGERSRPLVARVLAGDQNGR